MEHALEHLRGFRETIIQRFVRRVGGFRPATVRAWPNAQLASHVVRRELEDADDAANLLVAHYVYVAPEIQASFLGHVGVAANGAQIPAGTTPPYASRDAVLAAVQPLAVEFGQEALHYLRTLQALASSEWPGIGDAVDAFHDLRARIVEAAIAPVEPPIAPEVPTIVRADEPPTRLRPPPAGQLGVLDDLVVVALINAANRVDGAIRPEEAKRLVAELVRVNGQRHQSWYAAGLYRSLFDDPDCDPGATEAPGAREWWIAGRVVGLVRRDRRAELVALYEEDRVCRELGQTGIAASHEAAPHIFGALLDAGRLDEATSFISSTAIARSSRIGSRAFDAATDLLSQRRFGEARALLDLVREGLAVREAEGLTLGHRVVRLVERRQAHIRRMAGEYEAARRLLEPIHEHPDEPGELRSMLLTDIAMMDAGFRELADLRIPEDRAEARAMARRLAAQGATLSRAVALDPDPDGAAHAHYVLGILSLLEERGRQAEVELGRAISAFRSQPKVYTRQGLLSQATLHHALAVCLAGGAREEVVRAARALLASTTEELRIPSWMLESLLLSIGAADAAVAGEFFEALVEQRGEGIVGTLEGLADTIPAVALAFLNRARAGEVSAGKRAAAGRLALTSLLRHGLLDDADEAFAAAIALAQRNVGREELLALLRDDDELTRLREPGELVYARAELHAAAQEWDTAATLFGRVAEGLLARGAPWERGEAAAIVDRMRGIPEADALVAVLDERMRRLEEALEPPAAGAARRRVRLLVVGGNEIQMQYEAEIRERLRREAGHIEVEFIPTGWSSNWGGLADRIISRAESCDGIVLHYFVRTMLGRKVRAAVPLWCAVEGHGRDGILRGIHRCAGLVQQGQ